MTVMSKPATYGPELAPPGVEVRFLDRPDDDGTPLWRTRPFITPRIVLLHTNGASSPGSIDSAYRWANQDNGNTKPHYQVQRDGSAAKFLPSNRKGIGNYKAADFSLVIETQDLGWPTPGGTVGYTPEQLDTISRILAFEHLTHVATLPLVVPKTWDGAGVGSHTDPFGYPFWTNDSGKPCPGAAKKAQLGDAISGARSYVETWTAPPKPPSTEDDMKPIVTTWTGEPWPFIAWWENGICYWKGFPGPDVDTAVFVGAIEDRRGTPWPVAWKSSAWVKRVG